MIGKWIFFEIFSILSLRSATYGTFCKLFIFHPYLLYIIFPTFFIIMTIFVKSTLAFHLKILLEGRVKITSLDSNFIIYDPFQTFVSWFPAVSSRWFYHRTFSSAFVEDLWLFFSVWTRVSETWGSRCSGVPLYVPLACNYRIRVNLLHASPTINASARLTSRFVATLVALSRAQQNPR